jgi:type II secretory pathway pseudopilin PulG
MNCPNCGALVQPGNRFCQVCRKRVVPPSGGFETTPGSPSSAPPRASFPPPARLSEPPLPAVDMRRPGVVTAMAIFDLIGGGLSVLAALVMVVGGLAGAGKGQGSADVAMMVGLGGVYFLVGLASVAAGVGLLQMKNWARILQIVIACLGILSCGIVISVLMLVYLFKPGVKVLFSGKSAAELTAQDAADVAALKGSSGVVIALVVVVLILMMVAIIGIIAAIAIPSLLRARVSANESATIGNLRTLISAEVAYSSVNDGFYGAPACLTAPAPCLGAGAPPTSFLTAGSIVFDAPKSGYVLKFYPGQATATRAGASPSLESFAVVAQPVTQNQTGIRTFCGDSTGVVCSMPSGNAATGGVCPSTCVPLQ